MKRRVVLAAMIAGGVAAGTAGASFVATTGTAVNSFSIRDIGSLPQIDTVRITASPDCSASDPAETVRQGGTFYACARAVTDPQGITAVRADLGSVAAGANPGEIPLTSSGGPFGDFAYRSAPLTARTPLATGSTASWSVTARNGGGGEYTLTDRTVRIRSYFGRLTGEFNTAGMGSLLQHFRLSQTTGDFENAIDVAGAAGAAGDPQRGVAGALVGSTDAAVRLDGTDDVLTATRRSGQSYDHSMSLWVRGSAASGSGPGAVWSDAAGIAAADGATLNAEYGLAVDATGRLVAGCEPAGSTLHSAPGVLADGAWHHVAFVRVRAGGSVTLYVDGQPVASSTGCNTGLHDATAWSIGRSHRSGLHFAGDLDEVSFFGRALSAAEVADLHRLGTGTG